MKEVRNSSWLSIVIFGLPIVITVLYRFIESSIGPIVFFYSVIGGVIFGIIWIKTLWKMWNGFVGLLIGIPLGVLGMLLLINFFIWVTWVMGEMDYELI